MTFIVTGAAGFIGFHYSHMLIKQGYSVIGVDNLNDYYSPDLKKVRLDNLLNQRNFSFINLDLSNKETVDSLVSKYKPQTIFHLAAQAGVRLGLKEYDRYVESNLIGFSNIALSAAENNVANFLYASSSSVYGNSMDLPYKESNSDLKQISFYGATKYSNEILSYSLSQSTGLKTRGMRFFTVYGPMGRPDMAYFRLIHSAISGKSFELFGDGSIRRDFTYISDVVTSIKLLSEDLDSRKQGFADIVNIGGGKPNSMIELIECINRIAKTKVNVVNKNAFSTDVRETLADCELQASLTGFIPKVTLEEGISQTYRWATEHVISKKLDNWVKSD
jgi:UDP-glucuronate 4-epimerase